MLPIHSLGMCWHPTTEGDKNLLPHNFCLQQHVLQWSICPDSQLKWCFPFLRPVKSWGLALESAALGLCKAADLTSWFSFAPPEILHGSLALRSCVQATGMSRSQIHVNKWLHCSPPTCLKHINNQFFHAHFLALLIVLTLFILYILCLSLFSKLNLKMQMLILPQHLPCEWTYEVTGSEPCGWPLSELQLCQGTQGNWMLTIPI